VLSYLDPADIEKLIEVLPNANVVLATINSTKKSAIEVRKKFLHGKIRTFREIKVKLIKIHLNKNNFLNL